MTSTISRRQILSRSRDAGLDHYDRKHRFAPYEDYEEMWFSHQHLFKDHIAEVLRKWEQIDDEIWAKMIFMSRNRRIAKAYVRVPALIIDGSDTGFDGYRVGLNGFEDPFRDRHTEQLMARIGKGCRIGIDPRGNILIKRYGETAVLVRCYPTPLSQSCVDGSLARTGGLLEPHRQYVLFDMAKFEAAMMAELRSAYPDRRKLEQQCIVVVGFVRAAESILDLPIYVMLINIVALDLLKSRLNPVIYPSVAQRQRSAAAESANRVPQFVSIFGAGEQDEPIYGQLNSDRSSSHGYYESRSIHRGLGSVRPPKLPPRDKKKLSEQISTIKSARRRTVQIPWPDYHDQERHCPRQWPHNDAGDHDDDDDNAEGASVLTSPRHNWPLSNAAGVDDDHSQRQWRRSSGKPPPVEEDPYYSGLEARVTSKKHHEVNRPATAATAAAAAVQRKGLNWMMRKVLSSTYINSMFSTTKRQKKVPKSRSSNESSTDSDPYVSINDVYEPIYAAWGADHWPPNKRL